MPMRIGEAPYFGPPKIFGSSVTVGGQILAATGSAAAPGLSFAAAPTLGFFNNGGLLGVVQNGSNVANFIATQLAFRSDASIAWSTSTNPAAAADLFMGRTAPGSLFLVTTNAQGLGIKMLTELTTIAAAATTDTAIQIPANAIVIGVSVRVTTVIPTAATFDYGVAGATTRYGTGIAAAATTTNPGTADGLRFYGSAVSIRFTPNLTPAAATGVVRTTIHYLDITPPTS